MQQRNTSSTRRFRTLLVATIAILATLATGGAVLAQVAEDAPPVEIPVPPPADTGDQPTTSGVTALADGCRQSRTNGSGLTAFNWCFSDDGNVNMLEHSAGLEHFAPGSRVEGFCLAAGFTKRAQTDAFNGNFGLAAPTYPSATKVVHKTLDDDFRIEQRFVQSAGGKEVIIIMKVKNISDSPISNVLLTRYVDADISGSASLNHFLAASRSVVAGQAGSARVEMIPKSENFNAVSMVFDQFNAGSVLDADCYNPAADALNEYTGDGSMAVQYQMGTIFPDSSKTVRFVYHVSI